jgi:HEPN domain-containing protein
MRPETQAWVEDAEYDLQSAKAMLDNGRYFFVVFMCHHGYNKN